MFVKNLLGHSTEPYKSFTKHQFLFTNAKKKIIQILQRKVLFQVGELCPCPESELSKK